MPPKNERQDMTGKPRNAPDRRLCLNVWAGHRAGQLAQNNQSGVVLPVGRVINGL